MPLCPDSTLQAFRCSVDDIWRPMVPRVCESWRRFRYGPRCWVLLEDTFREWSQAVPQLLAQAHGSFPWGWRCASGRRRLNCAPARRTSGARRPGGGWTLSSFGFSVKRCPEGHSSTAAGSSPSAYTDLRHAVIVVGRRRSCRSAFARSRSCRPASLQYFGCGRIGADLRRSGGSKYCFCCSN